MLKARFNFFQIICSFYVWEEKLINLCCRCCWWPQNAKATGSHQWSGGFRVGTCWKLGMFTGFNIWRKYVMFTSSQLKLVLVYVYLNCWFNDACKSNLLDIFLFLSVFFKLTSKKFAHHLSVIKSAACQYQSTSVKVVPYSFNNSSICANEERSKDSEWNENYIARDRGEYTLINCSFCCFAAEIIFFGNLIDLLSL